MATLKSLVDETTNIRNSIVSNRDTLKQMLVNKGVAEATSENRLNNLINMVNGLDYNTGQFWLYKNGNEYTDVTGGFAMTYSQGNTCRVTKNSDHMVCSSQGNVYRLNLSTKNLIDFNGYNNMCIQWEYSMSASTNNNAIFACATQNTTSMETGPARSLNTNKSSDGIITTRVDISSLNSKYYVGVVPYSNYTLVTIKVYKIWLEK